MASYQTTIPEPDTLFVCPYDNVHMIRHKKMPYHLIKCRKNHPSRRMVTCPFNARHEISEQEIRYHQHTCPDKHTVERFTTRRNQNPEEDNKRGNTDVPTYFPDIAMPECDEDWDNEASVPRIGVQSRDMAGIGYYKDLAGLQRAQKRAYYENLRKGDTEANVQLIDSLNAVPDGAATATPSIPAAASSLPRPDPISTFAQPTIGRGRGLASASNRCMASVTPGASNVSTASVPVAEPVDKAKVVRKLKKKLKQIDILVERQANGEVLKEDERVKVALKVTLEAQKVALEQQLLAEQN